MVVVVFVGEGSGEASWWWSGGGGGRGGGGQRENIHSYPFSVHSL